MKNRSTFLIMLFALISFSAFSAPQLNSFPTATATIYLDFDGQLVEGTVWNGSGPINCAPSGFSDADITMMFNRIAEDYRPFNINITTSEAKYLAAPLDARMRIIITPTNFRSGVGGIAYTGSFTWGDDTPGFVFCNMLNMNPKYVAECCTHESGHTLGLSHQSKYDNGCNIVQSYNEGLGTGETSWAPVMGNSYYRNITGWNNGPTPSGCTTAQDNLSIITSDNGFTYRTDDHSDDINVNPTVIAITNQIINTNGIITTTSDKDLMKLNLSVTSTVHIDFKPYSLGGNYDGANLDVKVVLYNSSKQVVRTYDPLTTLAVTIDTALNAGSYYIMIDGTGNTNVNDYGSLGSYTISGSASPISVTPIRSAQLSGTTANGKHNLNWNIISDEPIKWIVVESSSDGITFNNLSIVQTSARKFSYVPFDNRGMYYRIKVTSVTDQVVYSNAIKLKAVDSKNSYVVSTIVNNEMKINSTAPYEYQLYDVNGRMMKRGTGKAGINSENTNSLASGMYVLQIMSNGQSTTERIIKQ